MPLPASALACAAAADQGMWFAQKYSANRCRWRSAAAESSATRLGGSVGGGLPFRAGILSLHFITMTCVLWTGQGSMTRKRSHGRPAPGRRGGLRPFAASTASFQRRSSSVIFRTVKAQPNSWAVKLKRAGSR